jgi:hypothetical protein
MSVEDGIPEGEAPDPIVSEDEAAGVTPEGTSAESEVDSFTDIDPNEAPEGDITQEWLNERYKQMQADYTRKRQADSETAKGRQEELEFLEALRSDPETQQAVYEQLQELLNDESEDGEYGDEGKATTRSSRRSSSLSALSSNVRRNSSQARSSPTSSSSPRAQTLSWTRTTCGIFSTARSSRTR